ncbi:7TM diverse intracellular signaling domain-containing protein [Penaeicola halotolerans]|uniref:7TM diverse intracellular signaling domain-containing protein n=1 Tax=Penaeicola halotolerans TaxID=2793196 RepID=UPI001CF8B2C7|nr:7TM diverse intracellular signaling domain-containing protein [Penaeicola halotolerans]
MSKLSTGQTKDAIIQIDDRLDERILPISSLLFFEDTTNALKFEEISSLDFKGNFKIDSTFTNADFREKNTYWIKLNIEKNPNSQKVWLIEFFDQTIDEIIAFAPQKDSTYKIYHLGDAKPFKERSLQHKNFELIIDNDLTGVDTYYFKVRSSQKADIRLTVRSLNRFVYYALNEYFIYGIFYGMILILALYNLLVYFAIREVKYLYYIFYLLSVGIYAMCVDGIAYQYLWPNSPKWNQIAYGIFSFMIVIWAVLFSFRFLNVKFKSKKLYYLLWGALAFKTVYFLIGLTLNQRMFEVSPIDTIPFFIIFYVGIHILSTGYKIARFFVIAYGFLFIGFIIKALLNLGLVPFSTILYYSLHIAFLLEMLFLAFALGDRIRILKQNRDKAWKRILKEHEINVQLKEKVNRELEEKVSQRTKALEEKSKELIASNQRLIELDGEIQRMNALLDKDNYKLKSNFKESLQARLTNKSLSFDEFKNIFPDKLACLRYLEEFKWSEGNFRCKNCNNRKGSNGPKLFSKRCTKCGYIESATSGTIFHGIKFPLEKAFYLAYTVIAETDKQTLDSLSEMLNLRRNTVWNFKKKIEEKITGLSKEKHQWKNIILDE